MAEKNVDRVASPLEGAIAAAGGPTAVARKLGVTAQRLSNWTSRGVPVQYCWALLEAIEHRLTISHLRPNDWEQIWPDQAKKRGRGRPARAA